MYLLFFYFLIFKMKRVFTEFSIVNIECKNILFVIKKFLSNYMKSLFGNDDIATIGQFVDSLNTSSRNWVSVRNFNFSNSFTFNGNIITVSISGKNKNKGGFIYTAKVMVGNNNNNNISNNILSLRIFTNKDRQNNQTNNQIIIYYLKIKNVKQNMRNLLVEHIDDLMHIVKMAFCKILLYIKENNFRSASADKIDVFVLGNYGENKPALVFESLLSNLNIKRVKGELDLYQISLDKIINKCSAFNFAQ
jgi:hypothetical protein